MEAIIQVMESTIGARDPYTVGHQQRVTHIACQIASEMGLSAERIYEIRVAGSLHDLGKIAVPTEILSRPGKLNDLEYAMVKTHPQIAYDILKPIKFPGHIDQIILQHHERLDGSGYPQGLKGHEILLEARILGVADVIEAICSHRPYRPALGLPEAMEEISRNSGILYDAAVVATCLKLSRSGMAEEEATASLENVPEVHHLALEDDGQNQGHEPKELNKRGTRSWARFLSQRNRSWLPTGTASLLGGLIVMGLIMMGIKGV